MPLTLIVAFFVILAFVVGASLLFRGFSKLPDAEMIAPVSELEKAQTDLKAASAETEKVRAQANTLAVQLEEMKGKVAWAEGNVKSLEETLRKSSEAQSRIDQLEKDLSFLSQKADSQARESIDVITRLAAETEVLKLQTAAPAASEDSSALKDENQKLQIQVDGYASKVKDLEAAVAAAQEAGTKYADVTKTNTQLTEENAVLKKNLAELDEKIKAAKTEAEQFKAQHEQVVKELQAKIAQLETERQSAVVPAPQPVESAVNVATIEEELQRVRAQSEEKIVQANGALVRLNAEMETLNGQLAEKDERLKKLTEDLFSTRQELAGSLRAVNDLKQSKGVAPAPLADDAEKADLQKRLDELSAAHQHLKDKEKVLSYKLTQSRAQALSLERLCDELKEQVERGPVFK
ncbi:MAG: hypothetical protein IT395_00895 [Candidatus Omnitrophica bacterium]|nr:hypothetical protein [Candidatus Omnitrophota bacterium]